MQTANTVEEKQTTMDYNIPVGFRFHPTEEELIAHYLKRKLEGDDINIIPEIELSNVEPCDIPALSLIKTDKPEWFFFSPIPFGSKKLRRATRFGCWKSHGHDRVINEPGTNNVIGYKKILAFYKGDIHGIKTNWAMHEYHAAATSEYAHQRNFVLCHLMKKADKKTQWGTGALTCDKGETSRRAASDCKNKPAEEGIPDVHGRLPEVNTDSIVPTWHQEQSYNANPRNENSSRQAPFEYTEVLGKRIFLILDYIPKGFRFHPREEELVSHYLKRKLEGDNTSVINIIPEIELWNVEPWDIPAFSLIKTDEPEWFFFSPIPSNDRGSKRLRRATRFGCWKSGGHDRVIKETGTNNVIGIKKIFAFHQGDIHGFKTNWVLHEYHAAATLDNVQRNFVLCHLMKKAEKKIQWGTGALTFDEGEPSRHMASDCKNKAAEEGIPDVRGLWPEVNMDSIFGPWRQELSHNANSRNENSSRHTPFEDTDGITDVYGILPEMNVELIFQTLDQRIYPSNLWSPIVFDEEVSLPESPSHNANFRNENSSRQAPVEITKEKDEYLNSIFPDGKFVFTEKRRNAFVKDSTQPESLRRVYYESSDTDAEVVSALCFNIVDTSTVRDKHPSSGEYYASKMYKSSHGVKASSNLEARKPSSCTRKMKKPEKDHLIARNISSGENSETRSHQSSHVNRKGSFICPETASSSQSLFLLLADIVLGILLYMLFIVISLELLSY